MGISKTAAINQLKHRDEIYCYAEEHLSGDNGTNVCASLIPMRDTMPGIKDQIYRAIMHGVYPLIGELEEAGFCVGKVYEQQKVSPEELQALKAWMRDYYEWDYTVPICPAVFGAIHINHRNQVTVDWRTGMSCNWPNMVDPDPHTLCDFRDTSLQEISSAILDYRLAHIDKAKELATRQSSVVFGGCGGQVQRVFQAYLESYREFQSH